MRGGPSTARVAMAVAAALALAAVVTLAVVLLRHGGGGGGAEGRPDAGACVAAPGAEQRDLDPDDSPEAAWTHTPGEPVVVHVAVGGLPPRYAGLVDRAARIWTRSPCADLVVVATCPSGSACSTVVTKERSKDDDDTDGESESDDRDGVRRSNTITLYTALLDRSSDNGALATIVHELGHTLGLVHRLDPDSVMNADTDDATNPEPDAIDLGNLAVIYGRRG